MPLADWLACSDIEHARYVIIQSITKSRITAGDEPAEVKETGLDEWGVIYRKALFPW